MKLITASLKRHGRPVLGFLTAALILLAPARSFSQTTHTIPASWAYPPGSQDATKPGFAGRIHQARKNATLSATIARANAQLDGTLIDTQSGRPCLNLVSTNSAQTPFPVGAGGTFAETNVVNYSAGTLGQADANGLGSFTINAKA